MRVATRPPPFRAASLQEGAARLGPFVQRRVQVAGGRTRWGAGPRRRHGESPGLSCPRFPGKMLRTWTPTSSIWPISGRRSEQRLLACLSSSGRYGRLKAGFAQRLERGPSARTKETLGSVTVGDAAQLLIGKRYRGVLRRGRAITSASSDESLHALRIRCKQLRYLLEFFRPAYGGLLKAETRRLKKLQDVLGEFQDACVAGQLLRRYAEGLPMRGGNRGQLIALGQLIGGQERRAAGRRDRLRSGVGAVRFHRWSNGTPHPPGRERGRHHRGRTQALSLDSLPIPGRTAACAIPGEA